MNTSSPAKNKSEKPQADAAMGTPPPQVAVGNNRVGSSLGVNTLVANNPSMTPGKTAVASLGSRASSFFNYFSASPARKEIKELTTRLTEDIIPRLSSAEAMREEASLALAKATVAAGGAPGKVQAGALKAKKSVADASVRLAEKEKQVAMDQIKVLSKQVGDAEDRVVSAVGLGGLLGGAYALKQGAASEEDKKKQSPMYDDHEALEGDQSELPDFLQKKIIEAENKKTSQHDQFTRVMSQKFAGLLAPDSALMNPEGAAAASLGAYGGYLASGAFNPLSNYAAEVSTNRLMNHLEHLDSLDSSKAVQREMDSVFRDKNLRVPKKKLFSGQYRIPLSEQRDLIKSQLMRRYGKSGAFLSALLGGGLALGMYDSNKMQRQAQGGGIGYGLPV